MKCIKDWIIQKFIDGEASPDEVVLIKAHLEDCPSCRQEVEYQRKVSEGVRSALKKLEGEYIAEPEQYDNHVGRGRRISMRRKVVFGFIAACASILVLILTIDREPEEEFLPVQYMEWDYNANQPISNQDLVIQVLDSRGSLTEYIIE
jgi:hypothetical protein